MFMPSQQRSKQATQLRDLLTRLRAIPQQLATRLDTYREQMRNHYRLREQYREEAWKQRLTELVEQGENALLELQREAEAAYREAETLVNALAQTVPVPAENAEAFLSQFRINLHRFNTHAQGFASDDLTANALRRLRESGVFQRDGLMALACWLYAGEVLDVHPDWVLTRAEWENLKPQLPTEYQRLLQQARELSEGWARVSAAFNMAIRYVRHTAQMRVELPAWRAQDSTIAVEAA